MEVLDLQLLIEDHQPLEDLCHARLRRCNRAVIVNPLPRQRLAPREEKQEETAPSQPRENKTDPEEPEAPGPEEVPAGVRAFERDKGPEENIEKPGAREDDAERRGDADGFECAVRHAQAQEVGMGAVTEEAVAVGCDGGEVARVRCC